VVAVAGAVARRGDRGGHVWALLQWVLGFRRLGWKVILLDRIDPRPGARTSPAVTRFVRLMEAFGLGDVYSLDMGALDAPVGLPRKRVLAHVKDADFLLNVMGYLEDEQVLGRARRRVFLDIDPGFGQMWRAKGLCDLFRGHDAFATVGSNVGRPDCKVPTCGLPWIPVLPPVALDHWPAAPYPGDRFTGVGSWRGPWDPVEYEGETYGLRVHEFRRFASVPLDARLPFEIALEIDPTDEADSTRLREGGWQLADPARVAGTPLAYRSYLRGSRAEFMIAKGMYVRSRSGWLSDRTACYLASGRPAVVQDTGFDHAVETGQGLVTFTTPEEAVERVREVDGDWRRHARAARELAVARFDSDRVLTGLVQRALA
jgi:hypothetical protein